MTKGSKKSFGTKGSNAKSANAANAPEGRSKRSAAEATLAKPTNDGGLEGAMRALELALERKGLEPVLLDVRELCSFCNYQLVLSGRSDRQVDAIADAIEVGLKDDDIRVISAEAARSSGQWALLDYGDFVVHVFLHSAREHYDIEGLWNDAPRVPIDVPADARIPIDEQYESSLVS